MSLLFTSVVSFLSVLIFVLLCWKVLYPILYNCLKARVVRTIRRVFQEYGDFVSPHKAKFFEDLEMYFVMGSRQGVYLNDFSGTYPLMNLHCNGGVFNLGHRNKKIIRTLRKALRKYDIGNHHLVSLPRAELARVLGELEPKELKYTIFGVSGGEAVDVAVKLAVGFTKRRRIVVAKGGYHGHTGIALMLGEDQYMKPFGFSSSSNANLEVIRVEFDDIDEMREAIDETTAAVVLETIPATLGIRIPSNAYLQEIRALCDQFGAQMILDEVQTGCGRTGKFFAFQHFGVVPDIAVLGKGLSGGIYPITATIFRPHFMDLFAEFPFAHVSTFGGSELGCEVAKKVIEITTSASTTKNIQVLSRFFREQMDEIINGSLNSAQNYIVEFRQLGLFCGIATMSEEFAGCLFRQMLKAKLLCVYANNDKRVLQFLPPLVMSIREAREAIHRVRVAFGCSIDEFSQKAKMEVAENVREPEEFKSVDRD